MHVSEAYNSWAPTYDTIHNRTRDLEAIAIRHTLTGFHFPEVVELGCGTGKNTGWLAERAEHLQALDFSVEMLQLARQKSTAENIKFLQADLTQTWPIADESVDLITCSLVLEHIEYLDFIFREANRILKPGGLFYCCELHPFRQYQGSGANFQNQTGESVRPSCFTHHISDYTSAAARQGLQIRDLQEWFDEENRTVTPRLVSFVFEKSRPDTKYRNSYTN